MNKLIKSLKLILNGLVVFMLSSLVILVFSNVVLRYVFHSGITWSEEMARYLFVWTVFLGIILAYIEKSHLGVDLLVRIVSLKWQKIIYTFSNILIVSVLILLTDGSLKMIALNHNIPSPVSRVPLSVYFFAALLAAVVMLILSIVQTYRFVFMNQDPPSWAKERLDASLANKEGEK